MLFVQVIVVICCKRWIVFAPFLS